MCMEFGGGFSRPLDEHNTEDLATLKMLCMLPSYLAGFKWQSTEYTCAVIIGTFRRRLLKTSYGNTRNSRLALAMLLVAPIASVKLLLEEVVFHCFNDKLVGTTSMGRLFLTPLILKKGRSSQREYLNLRLPFLLKNAI